MNVKKELEQILQVISGEDCSESKNLFEEGLLDSFDLVTLVVEIEAAFGIDIDPADINQECFKNINALLDLIKKSEN